VKLTTHLRLVQRSKNEWELYLHSPNTPSWRGAQLGGAQGQLYLLPLLSMLIWRFPMRDTDIHYIAVRKLCLNIIHCLCLNV
jgi:hypothetical protein